MNKLEKLSGEQIELMEKIKNQWTDYIFSCKNSLNREQAKIQIDWLYKLCGLDAPIVIFVDSPAACQCATVYAKELSKYLKFDENQVMSQVRSQVMSQVMSQVRSQVESQVESQVMSQVGTYENFCFYGSISDYGWISFYDFFIQIGIISDNNFNEFKKILLSGVYDMIQLNGFCIVSDMPNKIFRNQNNDLHNINGLAIEFKDGYGQHFVNGRFVPEKYFDLISNEKFTIEDFISEENEEYKSACIALMQERFGDDYMVNFFRDNLKEIDTFVDKKKLVYLEGTTKGMNAGVYTLFKGNINDEEIAYVRCYCPSTDRMFFLGVDPENNNAKDAIASLYVIPSRLKRHIKSISRQGERFSTVLTEEGKKILSGMSKEEISDVASISGNEYFSLMQYEF